MTTPDTLAALGYQPVFCVQRSNGDWTPLIGTTGGVPWGGAADAEQLNGRPYRPALRVPPFVLVMDVDDHPVPGTGPETIRKMQADLGPLPPTWKLSARGPRDPCGRYFYGIPDDVVVNQLPFK